MRKFRMSGRKVICPNASTLGYSTNTARPGSWIMYTTDGAPIVARVLGRIEATDRQGMLECTGWLAVVRLHGGMTGASVAWVDPADVLECRDNPPAEMLAWITGSDWPKDAAGRARVVAMSEHGTLSEQFITTRDDPAKPYNSRPEYVAQWAL